MPATASRYPAGANPQPPRSALCITHNLRYHTRRLTEHCIPRAVTSYKLESYQVVKVEPVPGSSSFFSSKPYIAANPPRWARLGPYLAPGLTVGRSSVPEHLCKTCASRRSRNRMAPKGQAKEKNEPIPQREAGGELCKAAAVCKPMTQASVFTCCCSR